MLKVSDGKCILRVRINNRELPFEFIVLSHCSHDVILGWDFLEASQAVIDCGQNELVLEDICRDSTAPDAWKLYATRNYTLKPHSLTRITASGYQTRGDINVVLDGSKHLLFEKNIAIPSMVSTYCNGKSDVWVANLQSRNQIIPRGICIGQAEPLNEGHLCLISDTSGGLDDQQETSESQMNCSLMMSPELNDEQRNKLSELLRKFSGLFTKTDNNGVRPDPDKVKAVRNFPTPKNIHDIRSFLGLCSYLRRFIKGFCVLSCRTLAVVAEKWRGVSLGSRRGGGI
ncbi:transposon Ty3-I Gag-Pol polyprotein [Trichonephila inaurata madagascariensis]|uniref:Transposon Ty3-I Gag-Pol polyprotein n=1 Tax=Trichonephila inaurata madagascariensis TaxID=2747483 RepID=A0A8X6MIY2_9ARAC|nr:transposon Ty3-I Gag-Pol polyprotein [Trichonephila inaurata madagascariensis]